DVDVEDRVGVGAQRAGAHVHRLPADDRAVLGVDRVGAVVADGDVAAGDDEAGVELVIVQAEQPALVLGQRGALHVAREPVAGKAGKSDEHAQQHDEPGVRSGHVFQTSVRSPAGYDPASTPPGAPRRFLGEWPARTAYESRAARGRTGWR